MVVWEATVGTAVVVNNYHEQSLAGEKAREVTGKLQFAIDL